MINGFQESTNGNGGQAIGFFNVDGNTNNVVEGNGGDGVIVNGPNSTGNTIGGATPAARNLIVYASNANTVQGNLIGTKGTTDLGNTQDGGRMTSSSNNVVTDNVVAFNGDANHNDNGVEVFKSGTATPVGNRILNNSISSNQAPGIDLSLSTGSVGPEQDLKDPDTGTNNLQNLPVITSAVSTGTTTTISGTLNSKPRKTFTIQLFSSPLLTNEDKTYLGQVNVKTSRKGKASFSFFGTAVPQADEITATATGADGTSELSDPVSVAPAS